jgi:hypothetical protein
VRDGAITESEFSSRLNILSFDKRVFWMQQCFSGGFIDDLSGANTVLITAVKRQAFFPVNDNHYYRKMI